MAVVFPNNRSSGPIVVSDDQLVWIWCLLAIRKCVESIGTLEPRTSTWNSIDLALPVCLEKDYVSQILGVCRSLRDKVDSSV